MYDIWMILQGNVGKYAVQKEDYFCAESFGIGPRVIHRKLGGSEPFLFSGRLQYFSTEVGLLRWAFELLQGCDPELKG